MGAGPTPDPARGKVLFQYCYACHSVEPNETGKLQGPGLRGVVGRPAASLPGFAYSPTMTLLGRQGLVWTETALDRFLADPAGSVPGTSMAFPGLSGAQDRADFVSYLKSQR